MKIIRMYILSGFILGLTLLAYGQPTTLPHLRKTGNVTHYMVNDKPFLMLGGELHNSSMGGFEYMRPIWRRMANANLNTVIASASWELVEPVEGRYDFALVDSMIIGARKENLKLIVIWFASWKNGESTYTPAWVKTDTKRFPLAKDERGKTINVLSTLSTAARDADAMAFAALMKHIRDIDGTYQTVIGVQVENEIGTLSTKRDFSVMANKAFNGPVPAELMNYLEKNKAAIHPGVLAAWSKQGYKKTGTWEEVFGKGVRLESWKDMSFLTEELFMAWNYAKYVGKVAAAGKSEYNLPMFVNAWLKQPGNSGHAPGNYPSGGPTPQMIDVWRAGAPSIDFIAPDIYIVDEWKYVCDTYTMSGNPLFIPETRGGAAGAARAFYTFGNYNTICFAPFGIDGNEGSQDAAEADLAQIKEAYRALEVLTPLIIENQGSDNLTGLMVTQNSRVDSVIIGGYKIKGTLGRMYGGAALAGFDFLGAAPNQPTTVAGTAVTPAPAPPSRSVPSQVGGALIICTAPGEYIISGRNMSLNITAADSKAVSGVSYLSLEEGTLEGTTWIPSRRLNGDEFRVSLAADKNKIYKMVMYKY
jgi:beta-galactosidase GanA